MRAEDVVEDSTSDPTVDLLADARARILDAIAHDYRSVDDHLDGNDGGRHPGHRSAHPVGRGIPPTRGWWGSSCLDRAGWNRQECRRAHSVILAREREIGARLPQPGAPSPDPRRRLARRRCHGGSGCRVARAERRARARRAGQETSMDPRARRAEDGEASEPLRELGVAVLVSLGSLHDRVPGIRGGHRPREDRASSSPIARRRRARQSNSASSARSLLSARARERSVRLFDAGGDKPLPGSRAPVRGRRGRAGSSSSSIIRACSTPRYALSSARRTTHDVCVLVPYVPSRERRPRKRSTQTGVRGRLAVGALVETTEAVDRIDDIASVADFRIHRDGTDLSASVTGSERANVGLSLDARLLRMIERVVVACRARSRSVTVCGELAADPHGARVVTGLGVHAVSISPARVSFGQARASRDVDRGLPGDCSCGGERGLRRPVSPRENQCHDRRGCYAPAP